VLIIEMRASLRDRLQPLYQRYVSSYKRYLKRRGYGDHVNDWFYIKRGFLTCWFAPGFHRFWRVWNPGIGYFVYRLYILLGGNQRRNLATLAAFVINGLIHNLIVSLLFWRWDFPLPFTFLSFGVFTIIFKWLDTFVALQKLPAILHLAMNVGLVILSFDFGFTMNEFLK